MTKLPAHHQDALGQRDYTPAGLAHADLASASAALEETLRCAGLTPLQRRDLTAARRAVRKASLAVGRHVDPDAVARHDAAGPETSMFAPKHTEHR
jgi:hypothetical protein